MNVSTTRLPLHDLLGQLREWQADPSSTRRQDLRVTLERIVAAYDAAGAFLHTELPALPEIKMGLGSLAAFDAPPGDSALLRELSASENGIVDSRLWVDGSDHAADQLADALQLALSAMWARQEASAQRRQLEALDMAVRGIANIASVDRVLELIVNRVRELVGSQYAALGIVDQFGDIDEFITSGISPEIREAIGPPPRGHGLLGLIIREDRSFLIEDIAVDGRRYGFPPNHPEMHSFLGVPVHTTGRSVGNLYLTNKLNSATFTDEDLHLVERFALHAGIAIENARLHEELGRLAIVEERQRISQDLHDSIIQSLYAISLSLEDVPELIGEDSEEVTARADRAIDSIHGTIRDIRNFIMGLQPELLSDAGLGAGVRTLAAEFQANTLIDLEVEIDPDLPHPAHEDEAHLLAVTREALSNIARHSAASRATLSLKSDSGAMSLVIGDNGRGFDLAEARSSRHRGLANLQSRAEAMGAILNLQSEPGAGTRIEVTIPPSEAEDAKAVEGEYWRQ